MGNCLGTCFGRAKKKTNYFVGRYKDYNVAIEFENLIEDDNVPSSDTPVITDAERQHLLNKKYTDLENDQQRQNAEQDAELRRQEENLKVEEEAMNEAKREAARLAKQARAQEQEKKKKKITANGSANKPSWLGDDEDWDVAGGEDDFEMFLDSVKARSQAVRANGFLGNTAMVSSQPYRRGENTLTKSTPKATPPVTQSPNGQQHQGENQEDDSDLEWDADFVSADTVESNEAMPVSGGVTFSGTDSKNDKRTMEKGVKVVSPQKNVVSPQKKVVSPQIKVESPQKKVESPQKKVASPQKKVESPQKQVVSPKKDVQPVAANGSGKETAGTVVTNNNATPKDSGIGMKPAVRLPNSTSPSNSKPLDSASNKAPAASIATKTNVLSNSVSVQETAPAATSNSARTENPAGANDDGIAEGQGSTKVVEDSIESLDEFDIDKFLEELDFDT